MENESVDWGKLALILTGVAILVMVICLCL